MSDDGGQTGSDLATRDGRIRTLSALVVNQIAAGEVIERPASVVKELIDNAIDADAGRIVIEIERGGIELVRVTDDGVGIGPADVRAAVKPHATSKIARTEDLDAVATMGFRGEALASIASVSRFALRSRRREDGEGAEIEVEGGGESTVRPVGAPAGTRVSVRNLFFNTPARRKFLRTPSTERGHCLAVAKSLAMSHPSIGFELAADGSLALELPGGQSPRERAVELIGRELRGELLEVSVDAFDDERGLAMWGLIGTPSLARPTTKRQHVFLNGRPIRDRTVQHALREGYRGLVEPGRHPLAVLMLEMSPAGVDVNVHPTKAEVRFRDQSMVHRAVYRAVRDALGSADLTPRDAGEGGAWRFAPSGSRNGSSSGRVGPLGGDGEHDQRAENRGDASFGASAVETGGVGGAARRGADTVKGASQGGARAGGADRSSRIPDAAHQGTMPAGRPALHALQVHNSYLVTQDEDGLVIIDQHALHERVMYERLKRRIDERGELESQRLLIPVMVEVPESCDVSLLVSMSGLLRRLGILAEAVGPNAVSVSAYPTFLAEKGVEPAAFVGALLEESEPDGRGEDSESLLHEILDMMACKAAVKAGDRLSDEELADLLATRGEVDRSSRCPHGRPTAVRLSVSELERQFGR